MPTFPLAPWFVRDTQQTPEVCSTSWSSLTWCIDRRHDDGGRPGCAEDQTRRVRLVGVPVRRDGKGGRERGREGGIGGEEGRRGSAADAGGRSVASSPESESRQPATRVCCCRALIVEGPQQALWEPSPSSHSSSTSSSSFSTEGKRTHRGEERRISRRTPTSTERLPHRTTERRRRPSVDRRSSRSSLSLLSLYLSSSFALLQPRRLWRRPASTYSILGIYISYVFLSFFLTLSLSLSLRLFFSFYIFICYPP